MSNEQNVNSMFLLLSIFNVNVIYYIQNNPELLNCVYNNSELLKLYILQYTHFITTFSTQLSILNNKLEELQKKELVNNNIREFMLNPNARDYKPVSHENPEEYYLPFDLLNFK